MTAIKTHSTDSEVRVQSDARSIESENLDGDWLGWIDNPSARDLQLIAERDERDKQVGALLREIHYCSTAKPPKTWIPATQTEEEFWTGCAMMSPGYEVSKLQAALARRRDPSIPAPDFDALQSAERRLRHDILILYEAGMRKSRELRQTATTLLPAYCEAEVRSFIQQQIDGQGEWRPAHGAMDIAVKALVKRTLEQQQPTPL